jgi:hypothetical protein
MAKIRRTWRERGTGHFHVRFEGGPHIKVTGAEADDVDEVVLRRVLEDRGKVYTMKAIVSHRVEGGALAYRVWWNGHLLRQSTWESHEEVMKSAPHLVAAYRQKLNKVY